MTDPSFDFSDDYIAYRVASAIERDNAPCSRAERRRKRKQRPPARDPAWVRWTWIVLFLILAACLALALSGLLKGA
jgi:hypothetical protein